MAVMDVRMNRLRPSTLVLLLALGACWESGSGGGSSSPGTVQFLVTSVDADEGTIVNLRVARSGGSNGAASVQFATVDGTAVGGADFTAVSGTLFWPHGFLGNRTISIPITDDNEIEPTEWFTVVLSNATGATLGAVSTATVNIFDNDSALLHQFLILGRAPILVPWDWWTRATAARCAITARGP